MRKTSKPSLADPTVTIKDVAEHLGISHSTVSRALGDHPYTNAETKQKVRQAVEKLGYVRNAAARSLRGEQGSMVGLILPNIENELLALAAQTMSHRCMKSGYQMVLALSEDDPLIEYRHMVALREARAAGIVITPSPGMLPKTQALLNSVPVVQFLRRQAGLEAPLVAIDGERALLVATQHLLQLNHRRIGYVGIRTDRTSGAERLTGYTKAHQQGKVRADTDLVRLGDAGPEFAQGAVGDLLELSDPPTALILGSNMMTVGTLRALRQAALEVPTDLSLICFGDAPWYPMWRPGLTTIGLNEVETVDALASALLRQLDSGMTASAMRSTHLVTEPMFIVRESTAPPKVAAREKRRRPS